MVVTTVCLVQYSAIMPQLLFRVGDVVKIVSFLLAQHMFLSQDTSRHYSYGDFGDNLLSSEGCDSFAKHPDLALTPNNT